jgi:hypothetical protein
MKDITNTLLNFASFLNLNLTHLVELLDRQKIDDDKKYQYIDVFIQANWEILVEMVVCEKSNSLEYYSSGADLFDLSYRVIYPTKQATHKVVVFSNSELIDELSQKKYKIENWDFLKFVSYDNDNYSDYPPFNYVLLDDYNGESHLFRKEELLFFSSPLQGGNVSN